MTDPLSISRAARAAPDHPFLITGNRSWTLGDLAERAGTIRRRIEDREIPISAHVAIRAANRLETVATLLALMEDGRAFVPIHPRLSPAETSALVADSEAGLYLDDAVISDMASEGPAAAVPPEPDPSSILAMLYTSGTTGRPKGAMLPRSAFVAAARASELNLGWGPNDRWLLCMPLCHVGGLSILTRCLIARRCVVLHERFDAAAVVDAISRQGVTMLSVVPTMLSDLLAADTSGALSRLRVMLVGGAASPFSLMEECARRSIPALVTYGLTEACSQVTVQTPRTPPVAEPGSGRPLAGTEVAILDSEGRSLPAGELGRIHVRGPTLMRGYWRHPPLTGWFDTGDLGSLDRAGCLHVAARRTDLIVTGGENVYPAEVEQVLLSAPGVKQALVFGVPDDRWGQVVACAIVAEKEISAAALAEWLAARLASHKRPRRLCVVDALPVTALGKPDRLGAPQQLAQLLMPLRHS
jgi:O-succinylbenzoic acid--CoA ligase